MPMGRAGGVNSVGVKRTEKNRETVTALIFLGVCLSSHGKSRLV